MEERAVSTLNRTSRGNQDRRRRALRHDQLRIHRDRGTERENEEKESTHEGKVSLHFVLTAKYGPERVSARRRYTPLMRNTVLSLIAAVSLSATAQPLVIRAARVLD